MTAEGATADGSVKVWAASAGEPGEPVVVSYVVGSASSNTTVLAYDPTGDIRVEASSDAVVKVDVVGYWLGARRTAGYGYAPDGLRLSKTQHTGSTSFHWDRASGLPLLLEERAGWFVTRYVYGPGGLPLAQHRTGGVVELFHHDQLGSTRVVTSAADGSTVAAFTYDAWGAVAASSGSVGVVRHGYAGQYTDAETGLQYLRARFYDPSTGQFLTRDPLVSLTREAYGYAANTPLNASDPSGLWGIRIGPVQVGSDGCVLGTNPDGSCRGSGPASGASGAWSTTMGWGPHRILEWQWEHPDQHADLAGGIADVAGFVEVGSLVFAGGGGPTAVVAGGVGTAFSVVEGVQGYPAGEPEHVRNGMIGTLTFGLGRGVSPFCDARTMQRIVDPALFLWGWLTKVTLQQEERSA